MIEADVFDRFRVTTAMQRRLALENSLPGQRPYTWTEAALSNQALFFGLFYIWCLLESNVGGKTISWPHVALAFALLHPRIHLLVRHVLAPRIHAALAPAAALANRRIHQIPHMPK